MNTYSTTIFNPTGTLTLARPRDWSLLDYTLAENDFGALTLVLPGHYPAETFVKDGLILVERSVDGAAPYVDGQRVWLIRRRHWKNKVWEITAYDQNHLLKRRGIDYAPDVVGYTDILDYCDDLIKTLVRQNMGSLVLDVTRDLSAYLSVGANKSAAPIRHVQGISRQNILRTLQDIAKWSYEMGTYLVFDIVCDRFPGSSAGVHFSFDTYTGQRGNDHRYPGSKRPILIGVPYSNLANDDEDQDWTDEITRGIATGTAGTLQPAVMAQDNKRAADSPFNIIESYRNTSVDDATALEGEARAELHTGIPRTHLAGNLVPTRGVRYGPDYGWGDFLTQQGKFGNADAHAAKVHVRVERDAGENIETFLESDVSGNVSSVSIFP